MKKKDIEHVAKLFIRGENLAIAVTEAMPDDTTNEDIINMCGFMLSLIKDEVYPERTMSSFMLHIQGSMELWSLMRKKLPDFLRENRTKRSDL